MNHYHEKLLAALKEKKREGIEQNMFQRYHGSPRYCYGVRVPDKRNIAKHFLKRATLNDQEFSELLTSLYAGDSYDERSLAGHLLELSPQRQKVPFDQLEQWLDQLVGWAEVDTTCQSSFTAAEILAQWSSWKKFLLKLNASNNIHQRRASLVLLVKAVRESNDSRLLEFSLEQITSLEPERDILITKAISWLLRSLTAHHKEAVAEYILEHEDTLPKIAIRETRVKLETGKKNHGKKL